MATWLVIVIFALAPGENFSADRDMYVFTEPSHNSKEECLGSTSDPEGIKMYIAKLFMEYGEPKKIQAVTCVEKEELKRILNEEKII